MMQLYLKAFDLTMMMAAMVVVVRMTNHSDKSDRHLLIVHYLLSSVPGVAAHAFSPSSWEAKAGGRRISVTLRPVLPIW